MMKKNIALVLSSGGSRGLTEIGVINELEEQGFKINSVAGSSIGSLIGGLYAMGQLPAYTEWVKTLNKKEIWGLMDFTMSLHGLLKGDKAFDKMKSFIPDMAIEKMNIPYAAVATDIINEKEIVFTEGSFYEAVRASVAIPTVFTPVKYKDTLLVDGGVLNPIPIDYVARTKDDILVVVNLYGNRAKAVRNAKYKGYNSKYAEYVTGIFNSIQKFIQSGSDKRNLGYLALLSATNSAMIHKLSEQSIDLFKPEIVIDVPSDAAGTFEFYRADELIELGRQAAKEALIKSDILKFKHGTDNS